MIRLSIATSFVYKFQSLYETWYIYSSLAIVNSQPYIGIGTQVYLSVICRRE